MTHVLLLVDRDADNRALYRDYLERLGWELLEAADGEDALAKIDSGRPSVVITDTRVPLVDGYELCRRLKSSPNTSGIRVVILTGDALPALLERAQLSGADAVLVKPCLPDALDATVRRLLGASESTVNAAATLLSEVPSARRNLARARLRDKTKKRKH